MKAKKSSVTPAQVVIGVVVLICIIFVSVFISKNKSNEATIIDEDKNQTQPENYYVVDIEGNENVKVNSDGVRENTSSKVKQEQDVDGIKISNASITCVNGISTIQADITNKTGKDIEEVGVINIKIKDNNGTAVREISTYIMDLANEETKQINASVTSDIVNATEVEFSR